jgi:hypothetical protein
MFLPLAGVALRTLVPGTLKALGRAAGDGAPEEVARRLSGPFAEHADRLALALARALGRTWWAVEAALAGDTLAKRIDPSPHTRTGSPPRLLEFIGSAAPPFRPLPAEFRRACLRELAAARRQGRLIPDRFHPAATAWEAARYAAVADPADLPEAEWRAVAATAAELPPDRFSALIKLLRTKPVGGTTLASAAVRHFARRGFAADALLREAFAFTGIDSVRGSQDAVFAALADALRFPEELDRRLAEAADDPAMIPSLDLEAERAARSAGFEGTYVAAADLLGRCRPDAPRDPPRPLSEADRALLRSLLLRLRDMPPERRDERPALIHAVALLRMAAGEPAEAEAILTGVAALAEDPSAKAECLRQAARAASLRGDADAAAGHLRAAFAAAPGWMADDGAVAVTTAG